MTLIKTSYNRRSFLKTSALAGGGLVIGFNWLVSCQSQPEETLTMPEEWFDINAYLKIGDNGVVTIIAPNPEFGQNVKTSMPMIVAEELDVDWKNVIVEQANFNAELYTATNQFSGGSQGIRRGWKGLRMAGATARQMLREAAAQTWQAPVDEITTEAGVLHHKNSGKSAGYGEMSAAAASGQFLLANASSMMARAARNAASILICDVSSKCASSADRNGESARPMSRASRRSMSARIAS